MSVETQDSEGDDPSDESTSKSTIECAACEGDIRVGDGRKATSDGTMHSLCAVASRLQDHYTFYVRDPEDVDTKSFAFWYLYPGEDGYEFPVLENTGGMNAMNSRNSEVGDGITPSIEFFKSVAYASHMMACMMKPYDEDTVDDEIDMTYDGEVPEHERWAAHNLVSHIRSPEPVIPELTPIRDMADSITGFGTPEPLNREGAVDVVPSWM